MAAPLRVRLADDHTMFRQGLAAILSSEEGLEVVGQTPGGEEAAALIRETEPDVVITELDMQLKEAEETTRARPAATRATTRSAPSMQAQIVTTAVVTVVMAGTTATSW